MLGTFAKNALTFENRNNWGYVKSRSRAFPSRQMFDSNETNLTTWWTSTSSNINSYFSIFLLIFGLVGNILNTLVLSQRSLRSNSCVWLFLISSIFNIISLLSGLTTHVLAGWFDSVTDRIDWLCKLRIFILLSSRTIGSWLIVLATFDRWLLSCLNVRYRLLSKLKNAKRGTLLIIFLFCLLHSPLLYCYHANVSNSPLKCYTRTLACRIFADQSYIHLTILWPLILMLLFGVLTMTNVRRIHHRALAPLLPSTSHLGVYWGRRQRLKAVDRHLLMMLLVQISFLSLFTLPQAIQMLYLTMTSNKFKSTAQTTIENSVFSFFLLLTYLASGMPFYIYTLSGGRIFRQTSYDLLQSMRKKVRCERT